MYDRILVPLDGSKLAEHVLPYARALAKEQKLPVTLLQSYNPIPAEVISAVGEQYSLSGAERDQASTLQSTFLAQVSEERRAEADKYLAGVKAAMETEGISVRAVVRDISAEEAITAEAGPGQSTLIVMSTHGRSGVARWVVGSVMDRVLHSTSNPLFVVRPKQEELTPDSVAFRNIILPVDGSPIAEQVLPFAIALAKALNATVRPVWIIPPLPAFYGNYTAYSPTAYQEFMEDTERAAREYVGKLRGRLIQEGVNKVQEAVLFGSPAEAVVELAHNIPLAFIAITTHGRSGVGRWVMGSVADRVVRGSGVPVLLVRAQGESGRT